MALRPGGHPIIPEILTSMCRTIIHRGPDDEGTHVEAGVGLGTRRLSIIDVPLEAFLSGGIDSSSTTSWSW
jgi:asparagine synthetase B (glutamine-hydrolysing)